ncbi:kelch-like protein 9 isoform X2 [Trichosurus vulpecula]|uniref:kelch-like protein 9 isoform X2 n=1 Tax=Trichosurus vulpecula TaxID=9337 RepID=UPI00186B16FB|nr:kelch-like protein 9 isoform X2 [Trichosurus vulpecula]
MSAAQPMVSATYPQKLLEGVGNLWQLGVLCDVTLEAGGIHFPAHRVVLASASGYCRALFLGEAGPETVVRLQGIQPRGLENVLHFLYSGRLHLSPDNVKETAQAAEVLLVRDAIRLCCAFQGPTMAPPGKVTEALEDEQHVQELQQDALSEFLERMGMRGAQEPTVCELAMNWLGKSPVRFPEATKMLGQLYFPLLSPTELQGPVQATSAMETDFARPKALSYHMHAGAQPALQTEHVCPQATVPFLLVLGGRGPNNQLSGDVWAMMLANGTWRRMGKLATPLYNHAVAVLSGFLYILGGQSKFDPAGQHPSNEHGTWLQVAGMLQRRSRFHGAVLGKAIVAVGGGTLLGKLTSTVEAYEPIQDTWKWLVPFPVPVADHAGTTHEGLLYIAGGFSSGKTLNLLNCYLPRLHRWIPNHPLTFSRCEHSLAASRNTLFCVGGRTLSPAGAWVHVAETECYSPSTDQWTVLRLISLARCQLSMVGHKDQLYVTGGGSLGTRTKEATVLVSKPAGWAWQEVGFLPQPLLDHASCIFALPLCGVPVPQERETHPGYQ